MRRHYLLALFIALAGCAAPDERSAETAAAPVPRESYLDAARMGRAVYEIVPGQSLLLVHVGRAGPAARLGHDHAVASEALIGYVETGGESSDWRADAAFPVRELVVDKTAYRERLGLDTQPTEDDIAGTHANMLKVLEPDQYPWITVSARVASAANGETELSVSVTVHGTTAEFLLPTELSVEEERLRAHANGVIRHSDFALTPFSTMGGLLRVADELEIQLDLVARRLEQ